MKFIAHTDKTIFTVTGVLSHSLKYTPAISGTQYHTKKIITSQSKLTDKIPPLTEFLHELLCCCFSHTHTHTHTRTQAENKVAVLFQTKILSSPIKPARQSVTVSVPICGMWMNHLKLLLFLSEARSFLSSPFLSAQLCSLSLSSSLRCCSTVVALDDRFPCRLAAWFLCGV